MRKVLFIALALIAVGPASAQSDAPRNPFSPNNASAAPGTAASAPAGAPAAGADKRSAAGTSAATPGGRASLPPRIPPPPPSLKLPPVVAMKELPALVVPGDSGSDAAH